MEKDIYIEELDFDAEEFHSNLLRDLALSIILFENEEINKSLFEYIQFVGDFELLGELTALTMTRGDCE